MKPMPTTCALCVLALTACGGHKLDDVERYVAELEAATGPAPPAWPEFAPAAPASYQAGSRRSPFDPPALRESPSAPQRGRGIAPDFNRAKHPLEAFPASALGWVGTIGKGAARWALVVDGDGGVHEVGAGDYLGENHGRIQRIGDTAIEYVELLPDGGGGWVERSRSLGWDEAAPLAAGAAP